MITQPKLIVSLRQLPEPRGSGGGGGGFGGRAGARGVPGVGRAEGAGAARARAAHAAEAEANGLDGLSGCVPIACAQQPWLSRVCMCCGVFFVRRLAVPGSW